jgi:hypothetical protein
MREFPEMHQLGIVSIEKDLRRTSKIADIGIQISKNGRIWICIDGEAVIRFKPLLDKIGKDFY